MPTPARRAARRLLDGVHLPIAVYLAFVGAVSLTDGPTEAMDALPAWLNLAWGLALIAGAALIWLGVATDRTRAESVGHMLHLFGVVFYTVVHLSILGDTAIVVAVLAAVSLLRMRVLRRSRAARREAGRILGERA